MSIIVKPKILIHKDVDMSNHISKEVVNIYDTIYKQNNQFYNGTKKLKCKERDYHKGVVLEDNPQGTTWRQH